MIVIGIAGVTGVLVSILAMAVGFANTIAGAGSPDRALIVSTGALQEALSSIPGDQVPNILQVPGIAKDAMGRPIAAAEALAQVQIEANGKPTNVALRGVGSVETELRPEIHLSDGRMFRPGLHELVVGHTLEERYGIGLGSHIMFQNGDWLVVGVFASGRPSLMDSEILTDAQTLIAALQRTWFNSVTVRLAGPGSLEQLKSALAADPTLRVSAYLESTYAANQARGFNSLLKGIGYVIGGMMATGALFGALNSLYASVSARSLEIATLRAIGFSSSSMVVSVMAEALLLSVAGGLLGALCAGMLFNGHMSSTLSNGGPIMFAMQVTPELVVLAIAWACVIGLIGGLFPAMRAARLPIARALNAVV
ncbi:MAG TPA: ABC transporter permease [Steroidobacteraceae bacterium]|nr:ABC transporter permease [Steroidobacteraceae bacterium]